MAIPIRKRIYLALGVLSVGFGAAGIFLPLLPTTPFLLLSAFLFARSSERWHHWLLNHRTLGPYIHAFRDRKGLTVAQKVRLAASFTVLMGVSFWLAPLATIKAALVGGWLFWLIMLWRMETVRKIDSSPKDDHRLG